MILLFFGLGLGLLEMNAPLSLNYISHNIFKAK